MGHIRKKVKHQTTRLRRRIQCRRVMLCLNHRIWYDRTYECVSLLFGFYTSSFYLLSLRLAFCILFNLFFYPEDKNVPVKVRNVQAPIDFILRGKLGEEELGLQLIPHYQLRVFELQILGRRATCFLKQNILAILVWSRSQEFDIGACLESFSKCSTYLWRQSTLMYRRSRFIRILRDFI